MKRKFLARFFRVFFAALLPLAICATTLSTARSATIWSGPTISFTEPQGHNGNLPGDQDSLTANVSITRHVTRGLYNARTESGYTHSLSPAGTEWAYGTLSSYASLTYHNWEDWFGGPGGGGPDSTLGRDAVLHLIPDDTYLSVRFTSWGRASGGFSYLRSTPTVPEPSSALLTLAGLGVAGAFVARRRKRV